MAKTNANSANINEDHVSVEDMGQVAVKPFRKKPGYSTSKEPDAENPANPTPHSPDKF